MSLLHAISLDLDRCLVYERAGCFGSRGLGARAFSDSLGASHRRFLLKNISIQMRKQICQLIIVLLPSIDPYSLSLLIDCCVQKITIERKIEIGCQQIVYERSFLDNRILDRVWDLQTERLVSLMREALDTFTIFFEWLGQRVDTYSDFLTVVTEFENVDNKSNEMVEVLSGFSGINCDRLKVGNEFNSLLVEDVCRLCLECLGYGVPEVPD